MDLCHFTLFWIRDYTGTVSSSLDFYKINLDLILYEIKNYFFALLFVTEVLSLN